MLIFGITCLLKKKDASCIHGLYLTHFLELFDRCILRSLSSKVRILVIHQLQFLNKVDKILILNQVGFNRNRPIFPILASSKTIMHGSRY